MEKTTKKRGRPRTEPYIELLIMDEVGSNQRKPQGERIPLVVLAGLIHGKLKDLVKPGERIPTLGTVEKKVQQYAKMVRSEDEPWTISTLDKCPIPPEALPKVLAEYKRTDGRLTVREAKWVARLSATEGKTELAYFIARSEQLFDLLGHPRDFEGFDRQLADLPQKHDTWQVPFLATASYAGILKDDPLTKQKGTQNER